MSLMNALVLTRYGSTDDLEIRQVDVPTTGDTEVLIRVEAAAVNDWDWGLVRGTPFYIRALCGLTKPRIRIPGVDVSGRVVAVGKHVTRLQVGDAVYGDLSEAGLGAFAEYVCAPADALAKKPDAMTFAQAAALPHAAMLAVQSLRDIAHVGPGQHLLINGAGGGVGTMGIQIARAMGVERITGVDHGSKFERMRAIGFDDVIDYRTDDFTRTPSAYDVILDAKTTRPTSHYIRALKPGGTYVTVGGYTHRLIQTLAYSVTMRLRKSDTSVCILSLKPNADLDYVNQLFESGALRPVLDPQIFPFNRAADAIQHFGDGLHEGKVIVAVGDQGSSE